MYFIKHVAIKPAKYYSLNCSIHNEKHVCFVGFEHKHNAKQVMESLITFKTLHNKLPYNDNLYVLNEKNIKYRNDPMYAIVDENASQMAKHNVKIYYVRNIENNDVNENQYAIQYNILSPSVDIEVIKQEFDHLFEKDS